jgi:hypothetical protein
VHTVGGNTRLPIQIPDLRFEQSYLNSIAKYVHRRPESSLSSNVIESIDEAHEEKEQSKEGAIEQTALASKVVPPEDAKLREVYTIEWGMVLYITTRDQILSPLIQGFLWCVPPNEVPRGD